MNAPHKTLRTPRRFGVGALFRCFFMTGMVVGATGGTVFGQELLWEFLGENDPSGFGAATSDAGDVNNDGLPDVIVGAPGFGRAVVFSGASGAVLWEAVGSDSQLGFGNAVGGVGDTDGDGFDDFVVAAFRDTTNGDGAGAVWLYSGRDGTTLHHWLGQAGDLFGCSAGPAGDVDADGRPDLIIGATRRSAPGYVEVRSGRDGALIHTLNTPPGFDNNDLGIAVASAGDVNVDGVPDFIVGDECATNSSVPGGGSAWVFSGADGSVLYGFHHDAPSSSFGAAVSGAGDVNRDGHADVIVGAWRDDTVANDAGTAIVFSGKDGSKLFQFYGADYSDRDSFGWSVAGAGDVNHDGYPDLLVGAIGNEMPLEDAGSASLFSGLDGQELYRFDGLQEGAGAGYSVSCAGDVNRDGTLDIIVGAIREKHANGAGTARVYSGNDLFLNHFPFPIGGGFLTLDTAQGVPGQPTVLFLMEYDHAPLITPISIGVFDSRGLFSFFGRVPTELSGHTVGLQSFALTPSGKIIDTVLKTLFIQ